MGLQSNTNGQSQRSLESKNNTFMEAMKVRTALGGHLDSRESTNEFERMDLDELHSIQEDLKRKM